MAKSRKQSSVVWKKPRLKDKTFCFTGNLYYCERKEAAGLVEIEGGSIAKGVSVKIDYLVVGDNYSGSGPSKAEQKAQHLNQTKGAAIEILDGTEFHQLFVPEREVAIAMLKAGKKGIERWNATMGKNWTQVQIDLSGADFRGCDLGDADLSHANLNGCNFRKAKLCQGELPGLIHGANFDGASLDIVIIVRASNCSFKRAKLGSGWGIDLQGATNCDFERAEIQGSISNCTGCNFKHAKMPGIHLVGNNTCCVFNGADLQEARMYHGDHKDCTFIKANLAFAEMENVSFKNGDFSSANLSHVQTNDCDFSENEFSNANLEQADVSRTNFQRTVLKKANLCRAILTGADFTGATLNGADFTDANTFGATFDDIQLRKAKGIQLKENFSGSIGSNVRELEKIIGQCKMFDTEVRVDLENDKYVILKLQTRNRSWGQWMVAIETVYDGDDQKGNRDSDNSCSQQMLQMAKRWGHGSLLINSVDVKSSKCSLNRKDLLILALTAWCEVFGVEAPTETDLQELEKTVADDAAVSRDEALAVLSAGKEGVEKWNAMSKNQRRLLGKLRGIDFKGLNLEKASFSDFDLQKSDFSKANLKGAHFNRSDLKKAVFMGVKATKAWFSGTKLNDASFQNADLRKSKIRNARLLRADFSGAKLSGVEFDFSDLSEANLSDTDLKKTSFQNTKFDEKTSFPNDFDLPENLIWAGAGRDPRLTEKIEQIQESGPIDFETFMQRLEENFDASRFSKALKMLKADSFQLFAQVEKNSVTGVVKSQSDAKLVYSCRLESEGVFACCTQNLNPCGGLRGALCKHLLVLIVGLTKGDELDPTTVNTWVAASKLQSPKLDKDLMSEILLRYKGAEAGEIDWRPTETVPEDYYAF